MALFKFYCVLMLLVVSPLQSDRELLDDEQTAAIALRMIKKGTFNRLSSKWINAESVLLSLAITKPMYSSNVCYSIN